MEFEGCGFAVTIVLVAGLLLGLAWGGYQLFSLVQDARVEIADAAAKQARADAAAEQARADAETARQAAKTEIEHARQAARIALEEEDTEQQRADHIHRETLLQIYSLALARLTQQPVTSPLLSGFCGALLGIGLMLLAIWLIAARSKP